MYKNALRSLLRKNGLQITFLVLCSLFMSGNAFSQKHWDENHMQISYDSISGVVAMKFEFYYLDLIKPLENAYQEYCDFSYSVDSVNYVRFMRASVDVQHHAAWSRVDMTNKLSGARLQFNGCFSPEDGIMWPENTEQLVYVYNEKTANDAMAFITIKWYLGETYKNIKIIQAEGNWHITGLETDEYFDESYYLTSVNQDSIAQVKTVPNQKYINEPGQFQLENKGIQVYKQAGDVVVKGVACGEEIKVYTVYGSQIRTSVANNDLVKINLPVNQVYIVKIGQTNYKVAM